MYVTRMIVFRSPFLLLNESGSTYLQVHHSRNELVAVPLDFVLILFERGTLFKFHSNDSPFAGRCQVFDQRGWQFVRCHRQSGTPTVLNFVYVKRHDYLSALRFKGGVDRRCSVCQPRVPAVTGRVPVSSLRGCRPAAFGGAVETCCDAPSVIPAGLRSGGAAARSA